MDNTAVKISSDLPLGFLYLSDIDSSIIQDVRYATNNNFMGRPVAGYEAEKIIITNEAAQALKEIQTALKPKGLALKVFDAYRPQMACDDFWDWANDPTDNEMKAEYYPKFDDKTTLFGKYIARLSNHSRGSTVDLTLIDSSTQEDLDMGSPFDLFDEISHTVSPNISKQAQENRLLLKDLMERFGFKGIPNEWWHFQLINEPFTRTPEDHFNFIVR